MMIQDNNYFDDINIDDAMLDTLSVDDINTLKKSRRLDAALANSKLEGIEPSDLDMAIMSIAEQEGLTPDQTIEYYKKQHGY